jgi:hypothetical protein
LVSHLKSHLSLAPVYQKHNDAYADPIFEKSSDAIDECNVDERNDLLDSLNDIVEAAQNKVKILISSRDDGNLASQLSNSIRIQIREEDNANDIRRFVTDKVGTQIQKKKLLRGEVSPELKEHVVKTLVHGGQGM